MGKHTGLKIDVDGTIDWVTWQEGEDSLPILQKSVAGDVDVVALTDSVDMWLNDTGVFHHDINHTATRLARLHGKSHQPYFGPVLITGQSNGETLGLSDTAREWLRAWLDFRCTAVHEHEGQAVHCGGDFNHEGQTHQNVVGARRVIWHGPSQPTMATLTGATA